MSPWGCYSKIQTIENSIGQITWFLIKKKKNPVQKKKKRAEMTYKWNKIEETFYLITCIDII